MKRVRPGLLYGILIFLIAANITAFVQRQWIGDWLALRNYVAPMQIASLASETAMTDLGRHFFYINRPSLEDKAGFNEHCSNETEHSVVLGCFHGDRQGIYVYDVQDDRLQGVEQVTSAHEMLHQAYTRLHAADKERIDRLLADFAAEGTLEQRIQDKLELYKQSEPGNLPNEMHSIFATEIRDLPAELETYYAQYFTDRIAVVAFSEKYQGEFAARKAKVDTFDAQLADLNERITNSREELEMREKNLNKQKAEVQKYLSDNNATAYQTGASDYNKQVAAYNALIDSTQELIAQYNAVVAERNAISTEEQQLQKALDSRLQEPASS